VPQSLGGWINADQLQNCKGSLCAEEVVLIDATPSATALLNHAGMCDQLEHINRTL
jgi:hypothetical protein